MKEGTPKISVVMPVYNAETYLNDAIKSILQQTFIDFEFIIINDGSTDNSHNIIESFSDNRIVYLNNAVNQGIVAALNAGVNVSKGKYFARMDADDISMPNRLYEQYSFLETNQDIALCGTYADVINKDNNKIGAYTPILKHDGLKINQLFRNGFVHPSILAKLEVIKRFKYTYDYQYAEDYFLFTQISLQYKVANIGKPFLHYRLHSENITNKKIEVIKESEKKVISFQLERLFGENLREDDIIIQLSVYRSEFDRVQIADIEKHFNKIKEYNNVKAIYEKALLEKMLHDKWYEVLYLFPKLRINYLMLFIKSDLFKLKYTSFKQLRRLVKKSLR